MPRAISAPMGEPGIVSYQLSNDEAFTILSAFVLVDATGETTDDLIVAEWRTPSNHSIHVLPLNFDHGAQTYYSLATGTEPWSQNTGNPPRFPQTVFTGLVTVASERIPPLPLVAGCTFSVYACLGMPAWGSDPITGLDTGVKVSDLLLWVEDDDAGANVQPVALPAALAYEPTMSV